MGKLIVIEGLDGSGKATQAEILSKKLDCRKISFPDYESDSSALVKMYLAGRFGTDPEDVNAYAAGSFYAVDRYASYKTDWGKDYNSGAVIVADRYATSNAIHQCCKLEPEHWGEYLDWLFHYEYELLGIPAPDAVIYLNVDISQSQRLMSGRYNSDESKKDIHEADVAYLEKCRLAARYCVERLGWREIECSPGGVMRSIEDIHGEIMAALKGLV